MTLTTAVTVSSRPETRTSSPMTRALRASSRGLMRSRKGARPNFSMTARMVDATSWTMSRTFSVMQAASHLSPSSAPSSGLVPLPSWRATMTARVDLRADSDLVAACFRASVMAAKFLLISSAMPGISRAEGFSGAASRVASGGQRC